MSDSSSQISIARTSQRNVNWIIVAQYTRISFVASLGSLVKGSGFALRGIALSKLTGCSMLVPRR